MGNLKNGLSRFSTTTVGVVNADMTLNHPDVEPRIGGEPEVVESEPASGITVSGPTTAVKISVKHQQELAKAALPPAIQRGFPVTQTSPRRRG